MTRSTRDRPDRFQRFRRLVASPSARVRADEPKWKQHTINGRSEFEAAGVFDVDNDGKLDIVSGDTWYQASGLEALSRPRRGAAGHLLQRFRHPAARRQRRRQHRLRHVLLLRQETWAGSRTPGRPAQHWTYHEVDKPGNIEAAWMVDLSGDGVPDVLPNTVNVVVWYEVVKKADGKGYDLKKHDFGTRRPGTASARATSTATAGSTCSRPRAGSRPRPTRRTATWAWHPDWQLGATGIQILARDVDGDGLSDVVYGMGHDYGLYWLRQAKGTGGERTWTKQAIDKTVASVHTLLWADIDGDGKANELVTGKRVYAHEIEPGATDGSLVAWYAFDPGRRDGSGT